MTDNNSSGDTPKVSKKNTRNLYNLPKAPPPHKPVVSKDRIRNLYPENQQEIIPNNDVFDPGKSANWLSRVINEVMRGEHAVATGVWEMGMRPEKFTLAQKFEGWLEKNIDEPVSGFFSTPESLKQEDNIAVQKAKTAMKAVGFVGRVLYEIPTELAESVIGLVDLERETGFVSSFGGITIPSLGVQRMMNNAINVEKFVEGAKKGALHRGDYKNFFDVTGDPGMGMYWGIYGDPITYAAGYISKGIRALSRTTGLSTAIRRAVIAGRGKNALFRAVTDYTSKYGRKMRKLSKTFKKPMIRKLERAGLSAEQIDDVFKAGSVDVLDDATMRMLRDNAPAALDDLDQVAKLGYEINEFEKLPKTLKAEFIKQNLEMKGAKKWLQKLQKTEPDKYRAVMDIFESSVVPVWKDGKYVWDMSEDFYKALKRIGYTDKQISRVIANTEYPLVTLADDDLITRIDDFVNGLANSAEDIRNSPAGKKLMELVSDARVKGQPMPEDLPIFQKLVSGEDIFKTVDPMYKEILEKYMTNRKLVRQLAIDAGMLDDKLLKTFMRKYNLNYMKHITGGGRPLTAKDIKKVMNIERGQFMAGNRPLRSKFANMLKGKGVDAKNRKKIMKAFDDKMDEMWDIMEQSIEGSSAIRPTRASAFTDEAMEAVDDFIKQPLPIPKEALSVMSSDDIAKLYKMYQEAIELPARRFWGSVNEINDAIGRRAYIDNAVDILIAENISMQEAIRLHQALDDVIARFGDDIVKKFKPGDTYEKGYTVIETGLNGTPYLMVKDAWVENLEWFTKNLARSTSKTGLGKNALKLFDQGQNWWRYWTLIPHPKFHIRNYIAEMRLNKMAGMPYHAKQTSEAMSLFHNAFVKGDQKAIDEVVEAIRKGIVETGFFSKEVGRQGVRKGLLKGEYSFLGKRFPVKQFFDFMETTGQWTEFVPRYALYAWAKDQGPEFLLKKGFIKKTLWDKADDARRLTLIDDAAAKFSRKFHPTYDNFTWFEQQIMRRLFPFYSWPRFNWPLQAEMFVTNPAMFTRMERIREMTHRYYKQPFATEHSSEHVKNAYKFALSENTFAAMLNFLPEADLASLLDFSADEGVGDIGFLREARNSLTPIKVFAELVHGKDWFTGRDLNRREFLLWFQVPGRASHLAESLRPISALNGLIDEGDPGYRRDFATRLVAATIMNVYTNEFPKMRPLMNEWVRTADKMRSKFYELVDLVDAKGKEVDSEGVKDWFGNVLKGKPMVTPGYDSDVKELMGDIVKLHARMEALDEPIAKWRDNYPSRFRILEKEVGKVITNVTSDDFWNFMHGRTTD